MNTMNDLLQMMQLSAAAQTQRTARQESAKQSDGSFGRMMKDRSDARTAEQPKTALDANAQESAPDETLREVAAALTVMMSQTAPVQIQTGEILPQQTAPAAPAELTAVVEQTAPQTVQTILSTVEAPAAELAQAIPEETAKTPAAENVQNAELPQTAQTKDAAAQSVVVQTGETKESRMDGAVLTERREVPDAQVENTASDTAQPLFREVQTVPVKVGETPVADTQSPELDAQLAKTVSAALKNGDKQVKIQLAPENLGTLTIDLTRTKDGALQVVLHTTTEKAADLLGRHAESLSAMLQSSAQGTVQVEVQRQEQTQQYQQFQQQSQHQQQRQEQRRERRQSGEDFLQQLRLGLVTLDAQAV